MKYFYKEKEKIILFNHLPNCLVFSIDSYNELLKFVLFQEETETTINIKILDSSEKEFQSDCRIIKKWFFDESSENIQIYLEISFEKAEKAFEFEEYNKNKEPRSHDISKQNWSDFIEKYYATCENDLNNKIQVNESKRCQFRDISKEYI